MGNVQFDEAALRAQDNGAVIHLFEMDGEYYVDYNMFPYRTWQIDKERFDEWMQFMDPEFCIDPHTGIKQWDAKHWSEM